MAHATLQREGRLPQQPKPFLSQIPMLWIQVVIIGAALLFFGGTYWSASSAAAAEAAAAGEESSFEVDDVYTIWSWIFLGAVLAESFVYGLRRGWAFASTIQITLIVMLTATFILMAQQVDRDFYEVGVLALIILTILQVPFGNIPAQANFRNSMLGLFVGLVIIAAVVAFSIWLVPYLIRLG
jgi:hypothetical protein